MLLRVLKARKLSYCWFALIQNWRWKSVGCWSHTLTLNKDTYRNDFLLWRRANARNVSFSISVRWSIYIINSVDKPNFRVSLPHRRSTTVSSETNPLYWFSVSLSISPLPPIERRFVRKRPLSNKRILTFIWVLLLAYLIHRIRR